MSDQAAQPPTMRIVVNGEGLPLQGPTTIAGLCREIRAEPEQVAVMLNGEVVPRARFDEVPLGDGDEVEIVTYAAGGRPGAEHVEG